MHPGPRGGRHRGVRRRGRHLCEARRPRHPVLSGNAPSGRGICGSDGRRRRRTPWRSARRTRLPESARPHEACTQRLLSEPQAGGSIASCATLFRSTLRSTFRNSRLRPHSGVLRGRRVAAVQVLPPPEDESVPERPRVDRPRRDEERRQAPLHLRRAPPARASRATAFRLCARSRPPGGAEPDTPPLPDIRRASPSSTSWAPPLSLSTRVRILQRRPLPLPRAVSRRAAGLSPCPRTGRSRPRDVRREDQREGPPGQGVSGPHDPRLRRPGTPPRPKQPRRPLSTPRRRAPGARRCASSAAVCPPAGAPFSTPPRRAAPPPCIPFRTTAPSVCAPFHSPALAPLPTPRRWSPAPPSPSSASAPSASRSSRPRWRPRRPASSPARRPAALFLRRSLTPTRTPRERSGVLRQALRVVPAPPQLT